MKKIILSSLLSLFVCFSTLAQQHPNYTQYTLNRYALNPAVAGLEACTQVSFGHRKQWVGFEGAPSHYFASFNTRLNKGSKFPKNFHGIGAYFSNDRNGFTDYSIIKFSYTYHIKLWKNYHLSVGLFGGIHQQKTSFRDIRIQNKSLDPTVFENDKTNLIYPEVSPGGFIYNKNFFLGLSLFQQYPARIKEIGTKENRLSPHYFFTGGYRLRGRDIHFSPSYLFSFAPFSSPTLDITLTVDYKQKISLALGSKYLNSAYATLQLKMTQRITLGYSYEYALNEINKVAPTTHEIVILFNSCHIDKIKQKILCPAYQ
ncbi:MAG: PorP/SprF family type IX secretion system membrane protein [Flavobacteriales bacterium]|nr:PorP/SprF family type IX secretion system membrane protein [Flavobacteriales bacterium]